MPSRLAAARFIHEPLFPLDVLKIDRAFMSTMSKDNNYADVVQTVVALAHTLNMQVTVEGVESRKQLDQSSSHKTAPWSRSRTGLAVD